MTDKPDIVIEDGIPIPKLREGRTEKKHLIRSMTPGQSYFVAGSDRRKLQNSLCNALNYIKKRHGINYTTRVVEGGVRVWRLE